MSRCVPWCVGPTVQKPPAYAPDRIRVAGVPTCPSASAEYWQSNRVRGVSAAALARIGMPLHVHISWCVVQPTGGDVSASHELALQLHRNFKKICQDTLSNGVKSLLGTRDKELRAFWWLACADLDTAHDSAIREIINKSCLSEAGSGVPKNTYACTEPSASSSWPWPMGMGT